VKAIEIENSTVIEAGSKPAMIFNQQAMTIPAFDTEVEKPIKSYDPETEVTR
jgi:hypothetical protein